MSGRIAALKIRMVKLIFGTYNSIASAELRPDFEDAYQNALKPFITAIYNHPEIKTTMYFSGPLMKWIEKKHSEFHTVLAELAANRTVEFLGGGFWEPMLPLIPAPDRVGQIEVMTTYLRKQFGKRSRGCWIPAQVWETHLASSLRSSGMEFVFLSEKVFPSYYSTNVPVIAEDQGKSIVVFPLNDFLSENFLKIPPDEFIEKIRTYDTGEATESVVSILVDGFRLSGCYGGGDWLESFFRGISKSEEWLECIHPGRYLRNGHYSRRKIYIPGPSYSSLMSWNNKTEVTGCNRFYRDFLVKYRESSLLYSKMMHIEVLTNQLRGDKSRKKTAKEELWKAQEHYAYWYGPTGGIFNSKLRHKAYSSLIEAEKATREKGIFTSALTSVDFDMDGEKEYLYSGTIYNAYVHTVGGAVFELDYLPVSKNYLATFSSAEVPDDPGKTDTQENLIPGYMFLDRILSEKDTLESIVNRRTAVPQNSLAFKKYNPVEVIRDHPKLTLSCRSPLSNSEEVIEIQKSYRFRRSMLEIDYTITNLTPKTQEFTWGTEINVALDDNEESRIYYVNSDNTEKTGIPESGIEKDVENFLIHDSAEGVLLMFQFSKKAELWRYPGFSSYSTHSGPVTQYQSTFIMPVWKINLPPLESSVFSISLKIGRSKKN